MHWEKPLAGLAVLSILVVGVGALASLPATFGSVAAMATGTLLALAMLAVVDGGRREAGRTDGAGTPYW